MKIGPNNFYIPDDDNHASTIAKHAGRYVIFRPHLILGGAAIDAGAHVGYWSSIMLPDFLECWAFEPREDNFECLAKNLPANVNIRKFALGAGTGSGTLKRGGRPGNSGAYYVSEEPGEVYIDLIDNLTLRDRLSLLKLDVEGMEISVLLGGEKTIKYDRPDIIMECNTAASENYGWEDDAPRKLLESWGYKEVIGVGNDYLFKFAGEEEPVWKSFRC